MAGGNIQAIHDWIVEKKGSKNYVDVFLDGLMPSSQSYMENYYNKDDLEDNIFSGDKFLPITQSYMNNYFNKEKIKQFFIHKMKFKNMPSLKYYIDIVTPANKLNYYDGETIDITGISIHKFSKEDDTDLGEVLLTDITFTDKAILSESEGNNCVKIKTYDEDGYLMECSYDIEIEPLILLTYQMYSNTGHMGGEVSCSSFYSNNYAPWYCFDQVLKKTDTGTWATTQLLPQWIQYKFESPRVVRKIITVNKFAGTIRAVKYFTLQGSNDGEEYTNIQVCKINDSSVGYTETNYINNSTAYLYYRLYITTNYSSTGNNSNYGCGFEEIELYGTLEENSSGELPMNSLVPIMTSNTSPSGEASCSNRYNGNYEPFYAFNRQLGGDAQTWATIQALPQWIQYKFEEPKVVKKIVTVNRNERNIRAAKTYILQGSNDGSTYTDIQTCSIQSYAAHYKEVVDIENETAYLYYRLYVTEQYSNTGAGCGFAEIDLYG